MRAFLIYVFFIYTIAGVAQMPIQVFAGNNAIEYNFIWFKDFEPGSKISLFNFTFFSVNYDDRDFNTSEIYQIVTYNFNNNWGLAVGGRYTEGDFIPLAAISYEKSTKDFYLNIFPGIQYSLTENELEYSLFGLVFYTPKLSENWNLFTQLVFEPLFNRSEHVFSYQQIRLGLEYKKLFQFGIGANFEQVGRDFTQQSNYGIFLRKEFN